MEEACATLPGVVSQGETEREAVANITEALQGVLEQYLAEGMAIPWSDDYEIDGEVELVRQVLINV